MGVRLLATFCFWGLLCNPVTTFYSEFNSNNYFYSTSKYPTPLPNLLEDTSYKQFSTCFYVNLKSSETVSQEAPMLSYLIADSKAAEIVFQFQHELQVSNVSIGGRTGISFPVVVDNGAWTHVCLTWNGDLGLVIVYMNGQIARQLRNVQRGYQISAQGFWNIEQSPSNGGQITELHFWDRIISVEEVKKVQNCSLKGNIMASDYSNMVEEFSFVESSFNDPCAPSVEEESCPAFSATSEYDFALEEMGTEKSPQVIEGLFMKELPKQSKFSVCARIYSEEKTVIEPFGLRDKDGNLVFAVRLAVDGKLIVQLGQGNDHAEKKINLFSMNYYDWQHYCFTWSRHDGKVQLFINGDLQHVVQNFKTGYTIPSGTKLYVYQVQYGDTDDDNPQTGFYMRTTDVHWWNYVINEKEAAESYSCSGSFPGNILAWNEDVMNMNGNKKYVGP